MAERTRSIAALLLALAPLVSWRAAPAQAADAELAQYNVVVSLYNAGQWQAAVRKIEEREKLNLPAEMKPKYLYAKALAYERGTRAAEARAAYEQLLSTYPQAVDAAAARLAVVYLDYGTANYDGVIAGYAKVDQAPLSAAERKNLALMVGESHFQKHQDREALAAYQQAQTLGADAATVGGKLFELRLRLGMHADLVTQTSSAVPGVASDLLAVARAEALLALNRPAEVAAEAAKVPTTSSYHGRAQFALASALLKQGKRKEAAAPLAVAIAETKQPPVPPTAHLALAECLLEIGKTTEAEAALARGAARAGEVPAAQRAAFNRQVALLSLRVAGDDPQRLATSIEAARAYLTADQLARAVYLRIFGLNRQGKTKELLATREADLAVLRPSTHYPAAALIYYRALQSEKHPADAEKVLADLVRERPAAEETVQARLVLATAALERSDLAAARASYDAALASPVAEKALGKQAWHEAQYNRAVVLSRAKDPAEAGRALTALVALNPADTLARSSLLLLGDCRAAAGDRVQALAAWKQLLAKGAAEHEREARERIARALYATHDHAGVIEQCAALARVGSPPQPLPPELGQIYARSLLELNKVPEAAALLADIARRRPDDATAAYECAVAHERSGDAKAALRWFRAAQKHKAQLPKPYADAIDERVAALDLSSGGGALGLSRWLEQVSRADRGPEQQRALDALITLAVSGKLDRSAQQKLEKVWAASPADDPRRYALGGILLASAAGERHSAERSRQLAERVAQDLAANESRLDSKSLGATVGAAMIYFYKGEAERAAGLPSDALASYETVLSAYPYNQWPDAATCGAAECYVALGEKNTAIERFREVVKSSGAAETAKTWKQLAARRLKELEGGK